jgi:hypothetical protein
VSTAAQIRRVRFSREADLQQIVELHRSGAAHTARWRERRQRGFRVYQIEVCDADIKALMQRGLLDRLDRRDPNAVERAIGLLLDRLCR